MKQLIRWRSVGEEVAEFLARLTKARYNIFISGGTGSGKTTFLNALSQFIPKDERIITIEDNAELRIQDVPNLVTLETRNVNTEGSGEITIRELIKTALRMRPDRIVEIYIVITSGIIYSRSLSQSLYNFYKKSSV